MRKVLFVALCAFAIPCFPQQVAEWDRWNSLCITHPPFRDNHIDSSQFEFYRNFYETLTLEESKIPLYRYDSLIHNAKDWQWGDSAFLKCIRCYWYLEQMMYLSFITHSNEQRQAFYESLKDSVFLHFYPNLFVTAAEEIPIDFTHAIIYGLQVKDAVGQKLCDVKTHKNGFIHPGTSDEHDVYYFMLKYEDIYYYLGRISPGDIINVYMGNDDAIELIQTSRRYNRQFKDEYYSDLRQYSHHNKKILKGWKKGKCEMRK